MNYETKGAMSGNHRKPAKDYDFDTFVKQFSEMKIMFAETVDKLQKLCCLDRGCGV